MFARVVSALRVYVMSNASNIQVQVQVICESFSPRHVINTLIELTSTQIGFIILNDDAATGNVGHGAEAYSHTSGTIACSQLTLFGYARSAAWFHANVEVLHDVDTMRAQA